MSTTRRRWVCPECGKAKLLSERPSKLATDRYCLPCSRKTGRLVERTCPKLEDKRAKAKAKNKAKKQRAKERADVKFMVEGEDMRKLLASVWRLGRKLEPGMSKQLPTLVMRYGQYTGRLGYANYGRHELMINRGAKKHGHSLQICTETLIHEVAHFMARCRNSRGHDDIFRAAWAELQAECHGVGIISEKLKTKRSARAL